MKKSGIILSMLLAGSLAACTLQKSDGPNAENLKPLALKAQAAFFKDFSETDVRKYFKANYIQHNPHVPTGIEPVVGFLPALKKQGVTVRNHRILQDGNFIIFHSTYDNAQSFGGKEMVAFDVWRMEDGKVAEHWDGLQPMARANQSGRTMVDGETKIVDLAKTAENKKLVRDFYREAFVEGKKNAVRKYISSQKYLQHNPHVPDGLESLEKFLGATKFTPAKIHRVLGEGNFVLVQAEFKNKGKRSASYDLFRVANGKIVEHWDVIQTIPAKMAHKNGMF